MLNHLWVKDPPPPKYIVEILAQRWHCPPDVVKRQSAEDFVVAIVSMSAENEVEKANRR